jgi:uncharacterized protein
MLKIVVDTNVIVSALIKTQSNPALIVSLIFDTRVKFCLSDDIWDEYQGVLARPKFQALDRGAVARILTGLKKKALWVKPKTKLLIIETDPEDNKFLEAAEEGGADFIVTGNTKHFPFKKYKKSRIVSPAEFLGIIAADIFKH